MYLSKIIMQTHITFSNGQNSISISHRTSSGNIAVSTYIFTAMSLYIFFQNYDTNTRYLFERLEFNFYQSQNIFWKYSCLYIYLHRYVFIYIFPKLWYKPTLPFWKDRIQFLSVAEHFLWALAKSTPSDLATAVKGQSLLTLLPPRWPSPGTGPQWSTPSGACNRCPPPSRPPPPPYYGAIPCLKNTNLPIVLFFSVTTHRLRQWQRVSLFYFMSVHRKVILHTHTHTHTHTQIQYISKLN